MLNNSTHLICFRTTKITLEIYIFSSLNYYKKKQNHSNSKFFRYCDGPHILSQQKNPLRNIKNRLGEILDNLLRIKNMMSVAWWRWRNYTLFYFILCLLQATEGIQPKLY